LRRGTRGVTHPVRAESRWVSVRTQRGNADDALLRRLYGPAWQELLDIPAGRRPRHAAVAAAAAVALGCAAAGAFTRKRGRLVTAGVAALAWAAGTGEFATARILPGPRDRLEVATMLATSVVIPPVATAHWLHGWLRWRGARPLASTPAAPAVAGDPRNRAARRAGAAAGAGTGTGAGPEARAGARTAAGAGPSTAAETGAAAGPGPRTGAGVGSGPGAEARTATGAAAGAASRTGAGAGANTGAEAEVGTGGPARRPVDRRPAQSHAGIDR
jgi:hypothetical protein